MRKISLTFVAVMLLFAGSVFGNSWDKNDPTNTLKNQVKELLEDYHTKPNRDVMASILFTVNRDNEIVVLSVETDNPNFEDYIKNKLNYKEVETEESAEGKRFVIWVRVSS